MQFSSFGYRCSGGSADYDEAPEIPGYDKNRINKEGEHQRCLGFPHIYFFSPIFVLLAGIAQHACKVSTVKSTMPTTDT